MELMDPLEPRELLVMLGVQEIQGQLDIWDQQAPQVITCH